MGDSWVVNQFSNMTKCVEESDSTVRLAVPSCTPTPSQGVLDLETVLLALQHIHVHAPTLTHTIYPSKSDLCVGPSRTPKMWHPWHSGPFVYTDPRRQPRHDVPVRLLSRPSTPRARGASSCALSP